MRLRAAIAAALLLFAAPAFAQNVAEVGGSVGGVGSISLGAVSINQPINPGTINAAAPGTCPANQYETQDTTAGPVCAQPSFSQLTGTASNSQLAGPLVNGVTIGAGGDFTLSKTDPLAVGNETLTPGTVTKVNGNTPGVSAVAHNFVTAIDTSARGTLAQPAFSDLSGNPTATQLGITTFLLQGTKAGDYTRTATTFAAVDATNLQKAVTVPVGSKLVISASVPFNSGTPPQNALIGLEDGATVLVTAYNSTSTALTAPLNWVVNGDGASHTIALVFANQSGTATTTIFNSSPIVGAPLFPVMTLQLMPSS